MAKKVTTLFIRDTAINLLVVKGNQVVEWASAPLEPGLVSDGVIQDEARVADELKQLFKQEKVGTRKVIVGLSGFNSLYRLITFPELPEAILSEAVKREAARVIPASLDEVYLSYQPVSTPGGETRVFLATSPRNIADALIGTLHKAGLTPYIMDLAPLALCRIANEPRAIIVNTQLGYLDIVVMTARLPELIRRLSLPSEAESLSENLATIAEELDRTVTFYNSSHQQEPLDSTVPVLVSGDLAEAPDTWQSLVGTLNYPVSVLPSPVEYPEDFPVNKFMVNIGLALKELPLKREPANFSLVDFNALPSAYLPQRPHLTRIFVSLGIIIGVGLLAWLGFLVQNTAANVTTLRSQLIPVQSRITQYMEEMAPLREQITPAEAQIEPVETRGGILNTTLTELEEGRERIDQDLAQIVHLSRLPQNVDLTAVNHWGDMVTVDGTASDEGDIFQYARSLRSSGRFSAVVISSIYQRIGTEEEAGISWFDFEFLLK